MPEREQQPPATTATTTQTTPTYTPTDGTAAHAQAIELSGQPPGGPRTAAEAQSDQLATEDPSLDEYRQLLQDIRGSRYVSPYGAAMKFEALMERQDPPARALLTQLRQAAADTRLFWNDSAIKRLQALTAAHREGTDQVDPTHRGFMNLEPQRYAHVTEDPGLIALSADIDALTDFYIVANIYGADLPRFAGYIQQMMAFLDAGQPVDHQQYWDTQFWLPDIFRQVIQPYLANPLLQNSAALARFLAVQNDFTALEARMTALGGDNPYEHTTRGLTKAELMAEDAAAPTYTPTGSDREQREQFEETLRRADQIINGEVEAWPGDIHGIIQRLQMMRDHGPYSFSARDVDERLATLRRLFDESEDPEAVRALNDSSTERMTVDIDPEQPMSVHVLSGILRTLANEPGEKGAFEFALSGQISSGFAYARGWAELEFFFTVTDAMTCVLGFDAAAAIGAGINLAGLVQAGVEIGGGYSMKARFANPDEVATWIIGQMAAINQGVGRQIFPVGQPQGELPTPVVLDEVRGFGAAEGSVDVGVASAAVRGQAQAANTTYTQDGQQITAGTTYENSLTVGATVSLTPNVTASGSYTFTAQNVVRDMNTTNEGEYHNHAIDIGIGLSGLLSQPDGGVRESLPPEAIQDGVLDFFAAIERQIPSGLLGGVPLARLHGTFDVVVAKLYESIELGRRARAGLDVSVRFEWNNVKEGGEYRNQYFRVAVTPRLTYGRQNIGEERETGASISASKSEVVFESVGSDTYSHVMQRYLFAWDHTQWHEFVDAQREPITDLIRNMATEGRPPYDADFAAMLTQRTNYPDGDLTTWLPALEAFFETKRSGVIRRPDGEG